MGCNCKGNIRQAPTVITSTPEVITSAEQTQTPDELHTFELNEHGRMLMEMYKNKLQEEDTDKTEENN